MDLREITCANVHESQALEHHLFNTIFFSVKFEAKAMGS